MGLKLNEQFTVQVSPFDEDTFQNTFDKKSCKPEEYVMLSAKNKAEALVEQIIKESKLSSPSLIIGADTVVDLGGEILEKPLHENIAKEQLRSMSGNIHKVHTGVSMILVMSATSDTNNKAINFACSTDVHFATLNEADIDGYIATKEPLDKAGSYGIQGIGGQFVNKIDGDFYNVMGLPMNRVSKEIANFGAAV